MYRVKDWRHFRKKSKYGNKNTHFGGNVYHSKFEAKVAQDLDIRLKAGELTEVKRQVRIDLRAYGKHIAFYFIDFVVTHKDGVREFLEVKGMVLPVWQIKWKLFEAQMAEEEPDAILTIIK
jgi:hypothetical protein